MIAKQPSDCSGIEMFLVSPAWSRDKPFQNALAPKMSNKNTLTLMFVSAISMRKKKFFSWSSWNCLLLNACEHNLKTTTATKTANECKQFEIYFCYKSKNQTKNRKKNFHENLTSATNEKRRFFSLVFYRVRFVRGKIPSQHWN